MHLYSDPYSRGPVNPHVVGQSSKSMQDVAQARSPSPANASAPPRTPETEQEVVPSGRMVDEADATAVKATTHGTMTWKQAHEGWTSVTGITLSPASFGRRIQQLGGGKLVKGTSPKPSPDAPPETKQEAASRPAPAAVMDLTTPTPPAGNVSSPLSPSNPNAQIDGNLDGAAASVNRISPTLSGQPDGPTSRPSPAGLVGHPGQDLAVHPVRLTSFSADHARALSTTGSMQVNSKSRANSITTMPRHGSHSDPSTGHAAFTPASTSIMTNGRPQSLHPSFSHTPSPLASGSSPLAQHVAQLESWLTSFQNSFNSLVARVDYLAGVSPNGRATEHDEIEQARDEAMDALAEQVATASSKAAKVDVMTIQLETLRRKVKRLEEANGHASATPTKPPSSLPAHLSDSTSITVFQGSPLTAANSIKRSAPHDADSDLSKRARVDANSRPQSIFIPSGHGRSVIASPSYSGPQHIAEATPSPGMVQQPLNGSGRGGHHDISPRKRGRPPKYHTMVQHVNELGTPPWEHGSWTGSQIDQEGYYRPLSTPVPDDLIVRGNIVRRGGSVADIKGTRRKPVRNEEGLLVRADGSIDRRSITSRANLKRFQEAKAKMADQGYPDASVAALAGASPEAGPTMPTTAKANANAPSTRHDHSKVMKQMFSDGVSTDVRKLNHAEQLFSDKSPEQPRMLPRDEMRREEAAAVDLDADSSSGLQSEGQAASAQVAEPANTDGELSANESSSMESSPATAVGTGSSFLPSTVNPASSVQHEQQPAKEAVMVPDTYSTEQSKASSLTAAPTVAKAPAKSPAKKKAKSIPESQDSYRPSAGLLL